MESGKRAEDYDDFKPLLELCRQGRLFEVQAWIAEGKAINPPLKKEKRASYRYPLQIAIDKGFHSLAQVLLEAGAIIRDDYYNALQQAIFDRKFDLVKLLVAHGADIHAVAMIDVFDTWNPAIMEYFIEQGADVETGYPMATALSWKIRTTLGIFKKYKDQIPSFQEQANIALRHHCREGNLKWVSLLLWAGADPFAKGPDSPHDDFDPEENICALEYAALWQHFEIFKLKQIKITTDHPVFHDLVRNACHADTADFLIELIKQGFNPDSQKDFGSSLIRACLSNLGCRINFDSFGRFNADKDSSRSREAIKMIHVLAKHGAKWLPENSYEINDARRVFLKLTEDYTVEFIWVMSKYGSCTRESIEQLLKQPSIRKHTAKYQPRISELLMTFDQSIKV